MKANTGTRATVVMAARERHSLAEVAIDSVLDGTAAPYRFIYLDVQSPVWLRDALAQRAASGELEIARFDEPLWPQEARMRVLSDVDTEYVVFIDNDVQVEAGWLDALVACADETAAGIVGPLYLWGDGIKRPTIHMAGGVLLEQAVDGGRVLDEAHQHVGADPREIGAGLARQRCDYAEFHCMLVRTAALRERPLDERIRCVHEHIDAALSMRALGLSVYIEPRARVTYLAFTDFMLDELAFFRSRWTEAEAEAGLDVFARKWDVLDDDRSFGGVRRFLRDHTRRVDPVRPGTPGVDVPMQKSELAQSRSDLLQLAGALGYARDELAVIANAYHVAHLVVDGGYRPCGRPFIAHLTGTASVLVRYGFRAETVAAGLLHAAYTHGPAHPAGPRKAHEHVRAALGGDGNPVEARVRAYTLEAVRARAEGPRAFGDLSVFDGELIAIEAANELDMVLSGEFAYSGRSDHCSDAALAQVGAVCAALGVPGLHRALVEGRAAAHAPPAEFQTHMNASYRIAPDRSNALPMAVNPVEILRQPGF